MDRPRRFLACLIALASIPLAAGCATDDDAPPGLAYAEAEAADEFPTAGASLSDTLGSLVGKRRSNAQVQARDVRVLRIDVEPWTPVDRADAEAGRLPSEPSARYAVVASFNCQAVVNQQRYHGEKTGWYLLPAGRLAAWDHYAFGDACTMFDLFQPATGELVADEKRLAAWIEKNAPRSVVHARETYTKGIAYARAGRIDDARASLAAGDAAFDSTAERKILTNDGRDQVATSDRGALRGDSREALVRAIAEAEAKPGGVAAPPAK
jgi:hypothetical protein